ncbi:MAG: hypothetical protein E7668_03370 [Ruminococcaceae bacterium]|nr:hypothetical protein [Oscillospiraceae bacterium]
MNAKEHEEFGTLFAHLEDLWRRAEQGMLSHSAFLSPRELHYGEVYLNRMGAFYRSFGGYDEAERRRLYLLPPYMEEAVEAEAQDWEAALASFGYGTDIAVLQIVGSGYRNLSHRDFLGSLLGLGLERSVLGDLLIDGEEGRRAVLFCEEGMVSFLETEWKKVANDKVTVLRLSKEAWHLPPRRFAPIGDTVASPRLDCVIAALCGLSREKARETVCSGLVEMNFESEDRPDRPVLAPCLISVRGYGRYRVVSLNDRTKKGRLRLTAERYL